MILGTEVFTVLKNESGLPEKSISSHWIEYLKDFNYENEKFSVRGLAGRGGRGSKLQILVDYIFQTPYRRQGKQFSKFDCFVKSPKQKIHT